MELYIDSVQLKREFDRIFKKKNVKSNIMKQIGNAIIATLVEMSPDYKFFREEDKERLCLFILDYDGRWSNIVEVFTERQENSTHKLDEFFIHLCKSEEEGHKYCFEKSINRQCDGKLIEIEK